MSGKPKKNKAPKAEKPIEDELPVDDIEEQPFEVADIDEAPKSTYKGKAPADAKKKKKVRGFRLSSVDPIILASFSIFMIACLIVSGITIYDAVDGKSSDKVAEYGDAVIPLGFQKNITDWIEKCHCTILPSHGGEGNTIYAFLHIKRSFKILPKPRS